MYNTPKDYSISGKTSNLIILALIFSFHLWACFRLLPPSEILQTKPLVSADHPAHAHRVHVYREALFESSLPWGYDPAVSGGVVMTPDHDAGAKPQQILGALLPFLPPGTVIRLSVFIAAFVFPLWSMLTVRSLGLPPGVQVWVLLALLIPAWLYQTFEGFFRWGLISFASASYMCPYVLALFLSFIDRPSVKRYLATFIAISFVFMLHLLGLVIIAPVLFLYAFFARPLSRQWRLAAILAPFGIVGINSFWFIPLVYSLQKPKLWHAVKMVDVAPDLTFVSWAQVLAAFTPYHTVTAIVGLTFAIYGFVVLKKFVGYRVVLAFSLTAFFGLFLKLFGSFIPVVVTMQPSRFLLPSVAVLSIPVGTMLYTVSNKISKGRLFAVASIILMIAIVVIKSGIAEHERGEYKNYAGHTLKNKAFFFGLPGSVPIDRRLDPLGLFVKKHTAPEERLLIQTRIQAEPKVLPLMWGREVVGNNYYAPRDPVQFLQDALWGKKLNKWTSDELQTVLDRWGISWVFTWTPDARKLFAKVTGCRGKAVGVYHAFKITENPTRFLIGRGRVSTKINRIELNELSPEDGLIVLRYRYHPAWRADNDIQIYQYPIPEDYAGFIALKNPPERVTLRLKPWLVFSETWPQHDSQIRPRVHKY